MWGRSERIDENSTLPHGGREPRHRFPVVFFVYGVKPIISAAPGKCPERRDREEVKVSMRKFLALIMVALLALTLALAVVGCGGGQSTTETTPPPAEPPPPMEAAPTDTAAMPADTAMGGGH